MFKNAIMSINAVKIINNIMTVSMVLAFTIAILMVVAGIIAQIAYGFISKEATTCFALGVIAAVSFICMCYYVQLH